MTLGARAAFGGVVERGTYIWFGEHHAGRVVGVAVEAHLNRRIKQAGGPVMALIPSLRLRILAVLLCAGMAVSAAENASGKSDPQSNPFAETEADAINNCISTSGDYQTHGQRISFVITLENKCEKRLKCEVFAYVIGAQRPSSGHAELVLGAKSSGGAAKKSYTMGVKAAGGTAQISRACETF